jgi:Zn-dependent peptidase ImmA (M78 family)
LRWADAHKLARLRAAHLHKDLDLAVDRRIDVFQAIRDVGLLLAFQPMPHLSGAYFEWGQAVLVNANHPLARQRYTAGHELGHFAFGHSSSVDPQTDPLSRWGGSTYWRPEEKEAEAFGAWFLMPRKLVLASLEQLAIDRPSQPEDVYALALRMGTSYAATARHLPNLHLATSHQVQRWLRTPPAKIKTALSEGAPPESLRNDVWALDERDNSLRISVRGGDRLVIDLEDVPSSGYIWEADSRTNTHVVLDTARGFDDAQIALENEADSEGAISHHVFVVEVPPAVEHESAEELVFRRRRPWNKKVSRTFNLGLEINVPERGVAEEQMLLAA